ncbi:MAG: hypothetical protein JXX14_18490 [Deltaproteobacteria bacterium]|nr:hypothetical protein [Deltaproteobacteria bacterium]
MGWPFFKNKQQKSVPREFELYDIHSHVLWGLDDGTATEDDAIAVLERYQDLGYRGVVATPHTNHRLFPTPPTATLESRIAALAPHVARTGVKLKAGAEVMCVDDYVERLAMGSYASVGNAFLVEFENRPGHISMISEQILFRLRVAGKTLILAHPERYGDIQERPELAVHLKSRGMLMQINLGSLVGRYGGRCQDVAWRLVENGIADIAATDIHRLADFDGVSAALQELEKYSAKRCRHLVSTNPGYVFNGQVERIDEV